MIIVVYDDDDDHHHHHHHVSHHWAIGPWLPILFPGHATVMDNHRRRWGYNGNMMAI